MVAPRQLFLRRIFEIESPVLHEQLGEGGRTRFFAGLAIRKNRWMMNQ
jgi:hypothetical protein